MVLVVIGALCLVIIALGLLYNCWQRRLPKLKHVVSQPGRRGGQGCPEGVPAGRAPRPWPRAGRGSLPGKRLCRGRHQPP